MNSAFFFFETKEAYISSTGVVLLELNEAKSVGLKLSGRRNDIAGCLQRQSRPFCCHAFTVITVVWVRVWQPDSSLGKYGSTRAERKNNVGDQNVSDACVDT